MMKPFEPLFYCLGDENSLTSYGIPFDFCFSEHTLRAFRTWLRTRHASLEALNQVYGTTYRSFDEVIPATTEQAQDPLNVPSWVDHRLFWTRPSRSTTAPGSGRSRPWTPECP